MAERTGVELLDACIERVWNERDDARRLAAIGELYAADAVIYEPTRAITGHAQISSVVHDVLGEMPEGFRFVVTGPSLEHHGLATTRWQGVAGGSVTISGSDVARIANGRIAEHWFFFDPPAA